MKWAPQELLLKVSQLDDVIQTYIAKKFIFDQKIVPLLAKFFSSLFFDLKHVLKHNEIDYLDFHYAMLSCIFFDEERFEPKLSWAELSQMFGINQSYSKQVVKFMREVEQTLRELYPQFAQIFDHMIEIGVIDIDDYPERRRNANRKKIRRNTESSPESNGGEADPLQPQLSGSGQSDVQVLIKQSI